MSDTTTTPATIPTLEPADRHERRRDNWMASAVVAAGVAVVVAVFAAGIAVRAGGSPTAAPGAPQTVAVTLGEMFAEPSTIEVPAGTQLTLEVTNEGAMPHDLKLGGTVGTRMLAPGESETVDVGVIDADVEAWCTVPGHREAGMTLDIVATGSTAVLPATQAAADGGSGSDAAEIDFDAEPAADWKPFDPRLQPAPGGTEHEITLRADETVVEVAPGVTQEMWTFNGTAPGPVLRGRVGDIFTVELINDGAVGHSIDFHASKVAWNDEMRTINTGESLIYQFEAKHAGVFMYHCGTAPALHHIGNGMHGAIIIDPPDLPEVDHEVVLVQHELYTGPEGQPGDLTKMMDDDWDAVVFNGYVNQYAHAPIRVETGDRVRAYVVNNGPSENSAFHVVGTVFDTMYKEGAYRLRPGADRGGAQVLDLQPAQGGFVELTFDEDGLYPIVTHKFSNVGKGALGMFQAGEVEAVAGGH